MNKPPVIFLLGPTASGKTSVAIELAQKIDVEIISADSMQVYRGLDIITAKPSLAQRRSVKHHLIDILDPGQEYSAAVLCEKAEEMIEDIIKRGKIPLVTGGTGMYVRSLVRGIFSDKGKDEALRKELYCQAEEKGLEFIYKKLLAADPAAAKKNPSE